MNTCNQISASRFVVIDVEWATRDQQICQIGLAAVSNGEIAERAQWLIQPPGNEYDETLYNNHHIRPEMTSSAPTLDQAWPEIQPRLLAGQLWAHNAVSAEMPAFRKSLAEYGIPCDWLDINDSKDLFCRPDCNGGNGLAQCAMAMGVPFEETDHHDALYDAEVLAEILIRYAEGFRPDWTGVPANTEQLRKSQQGRRYLRLGEFAAYYTEHPSGEEDVFAVLTSTCEGAAEQEIDVFDKGDKLPREKEGQVDMARLERGQDSPLYNKKVVITGAFAISRKEIERAIEAMGAKKVSNVTKNTDVIIIGIENVGCNKLVALEEQEAKAHHIVRVVGDADLDALLYGDGHKFFEG